MKWWVYTRIHSSWRLALAALAFVCGVAVVLLYALPWWVGLMALPFAVASLFFTRLYGCIFIAIAWCIVGTAYGSSYRGTTSSYSYYIGQTVTLRGKVKEDISAKASGGLSIQVDTIEINGQQMGGTVLLSSRSSGGALRGDYITVEGTVRPGFASFAASFTVTTVVSVARYGQGDVGRVVRDWFAAMVRRVVPEPQASLGVGFLTGQKTALAPDLADALKVAGLTHIVVASGYNLTILVRMARKVFVKLSKYMSAVSASLMIIAFIAITGLSPSMTRAGLVSGISLLSSYYGHGFHPLVLLPVAAAITVGLQPSYVWGDLGWQLSFSAFLGVMIVGPLLQAYFFGNEEPGIFRQILGETIAAHIVTLPIIAISFGVVSHVAIIANILVVPLVPLAMLLTFLCGLAAIVSIPFVAILALPTSWLLGYMVNVATFVSELEWAQSDISSNPVVWLLYALIVTGACWWMWYKTKYDFRTGQALRL